MLSENKDLTLKANEPKNDLHVKVKQFELISCESRFICTDTAFKTGLGPPHYSYRR